MDEFETGSMLSMYSTQELIEELETRVDVEVRTVKPKHGCNINPADSGRKVFIVRN